MRTRNSMLLAAAAIAVGIVSRPAYDFSTSRDRGALRHFDGGYSADHRPAGSRRRRLPVHRPTRSTTRWSPGKWTCPTGPANWCPAWPPSGRSTTADKKKWRFTLRKGVKFHDGSDFNADAVIWNLDKVLNDKAPQFDKRQSAQVKTRLPSVASYAKIDDDTVEITTKAVDSFFPYQMLWFLVSSPAQYEKLGKDWDKFASQPSGTGPFKLDKTGAARTRRTRRRTRTTGTRSGFRRPTSIVLIPMPEALTRTNALLAGQVDLIETPAPDAVPQLKSGRHADRRQRHAACLELSSQRAAGLALDRHPPAQGAQSRDRPRRGGRADERPRQAGQGPGRSVEPVVRQADLRAQIRSRRGEEAGRGSRLFQGRSR